MLLLRDIGFMQNGFDDAISTFMANIHNSFLNELMDMITHLGDNAIFWIIIALILVFSRRKRRGGVIMGISLVLCLLVNNLLIKNTVGRNRPFMEHPEFYDLVFDVLVPPDSASFVSGHACASFAAATVVFLCFRDRKIYWISGFVLATLISLSRVYLLVHYFTDVLGGVIIGALLGIASYYLMKLFDLIWAKIKKQEVHELFMYNE